MSAARLGPIAALFLFVLTPSLASSSRVVHFYPERITLSGRLEARTKPGPPDWGEHGAKGKQLCAIILVLRSPITVAGDPDSDINSETVSDVSEVQLVGLLQRKPRLGVETEVSGRLITATTGWAFTKVVLSEAKIVGVR